VDSLGQQALLVMQMGDGDCLYITKVIGYAAPRAVILTIGVFFAAIITGQIIFWQLELPKYRYWVGLVYTATLRLSVLGTIVASLITLVIILSYPSGCYAPVLF
jgi:hypothetical protein